MPVGIESSGNDTNGSSASLRHRQPPAVDLDQSVPLHRRQIRQFLAEIDARCSGIEIDSEITHQPFDDFRTLPVGGVEPHASHRGKRAGVDRVDITGHISDVLHKAVREGRNRRRAKPEQRATGVVGVTLEVSMQRAARRRADEGIAGPGKVIDADLAITAANLKSKFTP